MFRMLVPFLHLVIVRMIAALARLIETIRPYRNTAGAILLSLSDETLPVLFRYVMSVGRVSALRLPPPCRELHYAVVAQVFDLGLLRQSVCRCLTHHGLALRVERNALLVESLGIGSLVSIESTTNM